MATATRPARTTSHRPTTVRTTIGVLWFLGITAIGGSIGFFTDIGMRDPSWLEEVPLITNWFVPGLVLGLVFGVGSLVAIHGLTRRPDWSWLDWLERGTRHHWAWLATMALGLGMMIWIGLQLIWLAPSFLHVIYGAVGLALFGLSLTPTFRRYLAEEEAR